MCFGPYRTFKALLSEDEDCSEDNPMFEKLNHPGIGAFLVPASPIRFSVANNLPALQAPALGEHTEQILAEDLNLPNHEIARLFDEKIVA